MFGLGESKRLFDRRLIDVRKENSLGFLFDWFLDFILVNFHPHPFRVRSTRISVHLLHWAWKYFFDIYSLRQEKAHRNLELWLPIHMFIFSIKTMITRNYQVSKSLMSGFPYFVVILYSCLGVTSSPLTAWSLCSYYHVTCILKLYEEFFLTLY